jgi:hypothetical protein
VPIVSVMLMNMLVSSQQKFLFVHIPKSAGTSVTAALIEFSDQPEKIWINRLLAKIGINVNWFGPFHWVRGRKHSTARQMKIMYSDSVFNDYYKFAFVRNPWALLVSYYHYIKSNQQHHRSEKVKNIDSFESYIHYEIKRNKINQSRFVTDTFGNDLVDFIGRFESLEKDLGVIFEQLGVEAEISHKNSSTHTDYRDYYTPETAKLVAFHWAEDILRFGYTFDDGAK